MDYDSWKLDTPPRLEAAEPEPEGCDVPTQLQAFLAMLDGSGVGYGTRIDHNPPGTAVQVEHPDEDNDTGFWVTDWLFDGGGNFLEVIHCRGQPG
jgi:hypothetical protein